MEGRETSPVAELCKGEHGSRPRVTVIGPAIDDVYDGARPGYPRPPGATVSFSDSRRASEDRPGKLYRIETPKACKDRVQGGRQAEGRS